jgi:tRNA modification GTPase
VLTRHHDPIVAIATAPGRGAVGIVRLSGRHLASCVQALCGRELQPRLASYGPFLDDQGQAIDHGLALFFPAPHSYTGEDVLELQAHGGPVVLQLLLAQCLSVGREIGLRLAQPGEFTERAYLNGKLDLAQAEAVADLIEASTEAAAKSASRSLCGAFSDEIALVRQRLVQLRMLVEATLDFPEEEIDFLQRADAQGQLLSLQASIEGGLARARQGALLREGMTVVLAGQPNVGKSSLLNALAGAELAIVTPVAGTTRDKISQTIQIEGVPVHIVDTAGLREAADEVERIGVSRSWAEIERADALLLLHDLTRTGQADYDAAQAEIGQRVISLLQGSEKLVHVFNKCDLSAAPVGLPGESLLISAAKGDGLEALRQRLLSLAGWQAWPEGVYTARSRHVAALQRTKEHLALAQAHLQAAQLALDLMAEELRLAQQALGSIVGEFTADDLLGEIFGRFCIGK